MLSVGQASGEDHNSVQDSCNRLHRPCIECTPIKHKNHAHAIEPLVLREKQVCWALLKPFMHACMTAHVCLLGTVGRFQ